jgi:predicted RNA-binding Zn-ribbon protein involved in translation (DUF1610 family)
MAKNLISLKVKCPNCGKSLMDHTLYLNGKPSIKLRIEQAGKQGIMNLCSTYGCFDKQSSMELISGEVVSLSCMHCKKELNGAHTCDLCGAPIVDFHLDKGGMVHFCSRIGCEKHYVSFEDIYETLTSFYHEYDYGARDTDF